MCQYVWDFSSSTVKRDDAMICVARAMICVARHSHDGNIHSDVPLSCVAKIVFCNNGAFASCDGPIVGGNIKICNPIVRHSAVNLSVGPMVISMNTHDARFPHFYARSSYEAKSAMRNGLWIMAFKTRILYMHDIVEFVILVTIAKLKVESTCNCHGRCRHWIISMETHQQYRSISSLPGIICNTI